MTSSTEILSLINGSSHQNNIQQNSVALETAEENYHEELIITRINNDIKKSHSCSNGLTLIRYILPKISEDNLLKYGLHWITKSIQILGINQSNIFEITLACQTLADLVVSCKRKPELHKQISMQNVKQIITNINNLKNKERCGAMYYLIAVLLYHYSEVCERYQVGGIKLQRNTA